MTGEYTVKVDAKVEQSEKLADVFKQLGGEGLSAINKTGCPYCSHNKVLAGFNDLATLLPDVAAEWSDRNYPLLSTQVTVFANRKAWWRCKACRQAGRR